jgi:hypothetical protein
MSAKNFNVGDTVKVIKCLYGHHFFIDEIVKVKEVNLANYKCEGTDGTTWYLTDEELEAIHESDTETTELQ